MPYIPKHRRAEAELWPQNVGELTFAVYLLIIEYWRRQGAGARFQHIAEIFGALKSAESEFIRNIAEPYEKQKQAENGDV
jgi:hypothetical protein